MQRMENLCHVGRLSAVSRTPEFMRQTNADERSSFESIQIQERILYLSPMERGQDSISERHLRQTAAATRQTKPEQIFRQSCKATHRDQQS